MKVERTSEFIPVLGTNGTGKTTFTKNVVLGAAASGRRALIIDYDGAEKAWREFEVINVADKEQVRTFTGVKRCVYSENMDETLNLIFKHYHNGILVLDDCRMYLKSALSESIEQLVIRRRQKMLDIFAVAHGFTEVPPRLYSFCTRMVLFKTKDSIKRASRNLMNPDVAIAAQQRVNQKALSNPHYNEMITF